MNHFICLDLEASCNNKPKMAPDQMEIIEIGACFVSKDGEVLDQFQTFVKPSSSIPLTPFCIELTTITQSQVDTAPGFVEAIALFEAWIEKCTDTYGAPDFWGSWGDYDRKQFERNAALLGLNAPAFLGALKHVNLKYRYGRVVGIEGKDPGLGKALNCESIRFVGVPHRGIDDALNIAKIAMVSLGLRESTWRDRPALKKSALGVSK